MDIIEFRGKRVDNGEWVYGYVDATMYKDIVVIHTETGTFGVNPDTVGQYTGIVDSEGNRIFEGDIIQGEMEYKHLIRYDASCTRFAAILTDYVNDKISEDFWTGSLEKRWVDEFHKVVVGNRYDNPEIIGSGK